MTDIGFLNEPHPIIQPKRPAQGEKMTIHHHRCLRPVLSLAFGRPVSTMGAKSRPHEQHEKDWPPTNQPT